MDLLNLNETLLNKIASFDNIYNAFRDCSRGKKQSLGYKNFLFAYGEKLKQIEEELKKTKNYKWSGYREFYVYDPKKRLIMAAPFKDRVAHTAIHRVVEPIIEPYLGKRSYACRVGMGNRNAAIRVFKQVQFMKKERYCIKLDVRKYFESINHEILFDSFKRFLPDNSVDNLLKNLIVSHCKYKEVGRGVPIGNLTSQLFANFYLREFDFLACKLLGIDFYNDENLEDNFYLRYMDDSVIITKNKAETFRVANKLIEFARERLKLNIPNEKKVMLANDPIPFLGFVLDSGYYRPLRRNERKLEKKLKRLDKKNAPNSKKAVIIQSYKAWRQLMV